MPISLEQWRAAVGRWVARIQRTLIIRRGVKWAPSCASSQEGVSSPSGQPHSGEKKCMTRRKGRKKHKLDSFDDPAITTDDFYGGIIALATMLTCFGGNTSKDCSDRNPVGPLKELLGCTGLGALLIVTMILLLRSGDVEMNPGPVERGGASRFKEGTEASSSEDRILHQPVHSWKRYAILLRTHVSRNAAGKGRAVLEGVGLSHERIEMCYRNHPLDEEGAVQAGLQEWVSSAPTTDPPTWKVLLYAMDYAGIARQHIDSLKAELLSKTVSEGSRQEPQGRAQSDPHGVSPSSVRGQELRWEGEPAPAAAKVDAGTPFPNMDVNPFGSDLQGAMLEEVYKSALGCFMNGSERLVSAAEHGDHADQYLRKAFNLSAERHQELLEQAQLGQKPDLALHVKVKRADNLARKGHGKSNPYCKLAVVKAEQKQMLQRDLADWVKEGTLGKLLIRQTDVKYDTLEPEWDQDVTIPLMDAGSGFLAVEIWDSEDETELKQMKGLKRVNPFKKLRGKNDFLGKAYISLEDLPSKGEDSWFDLQSHHGHPRGRVQMKLHIINVGVVHKVVLEHYQKLFEAVCTFEARGTPDSASLEAQDKWSPNWSGKLTPSAEMLLSLFASQYSITQLEQSIVHLDSLLKYHRCYHISLSAFQDIYTTILSLQDELEQGMASENGEAALENLSQDWQKLCACTHLLSNEIRDVIRNHSVELIDNPTSSLGTDRRRQKIGLLIEKASRMSLPPEEANLSELIDNPTSSLETDRLRRKIGLLKDLYQVKVFQMSLPPEEANLSEVVAKEIEHSCAHWYCLQEKKAKEESPSKLLAYLSLVQSVAAFHKTSREALKIIFAEVEVDYLETVYIAVEGQLARGLPDALSAGPPQDPKTTYTLYLSLKEFKSFSTLVSEKRHDQLKLTHFHVHFQKMVNGWIGLAAQRFKDAAMRAALIAEEEETVTEEAEFSSTARDLIDLVVTEVCSSWKKLDWPVAAESFVYLTTLIKEVCSGIVMFSKERCRRLRQANFFSPTTDNFMTTKKLCIALNDIEQVRKGMQELPEFVKWPSFQEVMAAETSLEETDAADQALKDILSTMDQTILQALTSLTEHIAEKMRPEIKRGLQNLMQAPTQDAVKEVISPLMTYLENNLRELRTSFIRSVFLELLSHIWFVLVENMWKYARSTRNETVTFRFHHLLNVLFGFFHVEGEGLAKEVMESQQYTLLAYRVMPTDKMIQQYCETLADFQTNAPNTKGNITVMVGYMTEKQAVELILVRASNLPPVTVDKSCDTYLKISLLLPGENFSTAGRQKCRVQEQSLNPVLDEHFSFPVMSQQHLQMQGAVLAIEVYSHGRLHNHTPIGVIVIRCKDIPILAQNTSPEDNELAQEQPQKLTLTLPIFAPFDSPALNELSQRHNDAVAIDFAKRMKKLIARQADQQTGQQTNQQDSCEEAEHSPP